MTYPAPKYLKDDPWFGPAFYSDKQRTKMLQQQLHMKETKIFYSVSGCNKKYDTIHEMMYAMSTNSDKTTVQLDPIGGSENFQGGSEIYHE
tara:strand:+ start:1833 stop:2105 length:273 start_codon:yes stop_codon:yes gene_type:complete